jgi:protein-S-isoprenylcysteine O-methyltransferase Ste14
VSILLALEFIVCIAFVIEEFLLIKPVSTVSKSDPVSRRLELAAMWWPAVGMALTASTIRTLGGVRLGGALNALGFAMCAAALVLRYWSRRTLGRFFTIGVVKQDNHSVVRDGPYGIVRHPAYLGLTLFYAGFPMMIGNWFGFAVLSIPALAIFISLVLVEDRRLSELLGEPYRSYRHQVARWIPGVW